MSIFSNRRGVSLIGALVASIIGMLAVYYLSMGLVAGLRQVSHVEHKLELNSIRAMLQTRVDCTKTLNIAAAPNFCPAVGQIPLLDSAGNVIVSNSAVADTSNTIGEYTIVTQCSHSGPNPGLDIRGTRIHAGSSVSSTNDADYVKQPVHGVVQFSDSRSKLYAPALVPCQHIFTGGPPPPPVDGVPTGAVMYFNLDDCPTGWSALPAADGRYIVGVPDAISSAANRAAASATGTQLTNMENRATGNHSHVGLGVTGTTNTPVIDENDDFVAISSITYGAPIGSVNPAPPGGTNAPYIQLLVCQKN